MATKKSVKQDDDELAPLRNEEKQLRMEIGKLVAEQIKHSEFSRAELAEKLGYTSSAQLSKWAKGTAPITVDRLALLAEILRVPVSEFFPERVRPRAWQKALHGAIVREDLRKALEIVLDQFPPPIEQK